MKTSFNASLMMLSSLFSHFSLLLGCAFPIWMSSGFNDRPLAPFAGILSLGIGDTMVSVLNIDIILSLLCLFATLIVTASRDLILGSFQGQNCS